MDDVRITTLAEQLHLIHPQHPSLGCLLGNRENIVSAARECPTAIQATEILLNLPRNKLKAFVFGQFAILPFSTTDQEQLHQFVLAFLAQCKSVPDSFAQRCMEYLAIVGVSTNFETLLKFFKAQLTKTDVKTALARRGLMVPPQVHAAKTVAQTSQYEISATDQNELARLAQQMAE